MSTGRSRVFLELCIARRTVQHKECVEQLCDRIREAKEQSPIIKGHKHVMLTPFGRKARSRSPRGESGGSRVEGIPLPLSPSTLSPSTIRDRVIPLPPSHSTIRRRTILRTTSLLVF